MLVDSIPTESAWLLEIARAIGILAQANKSSEVIEILRIKDERISQELFVSNKFCAKCKSIKSLAMVDGGRPHTCKKRWIQDIPGFYGFWGSHISFISSL